jgi:cyanophycin synthetase
VTTRHAEPAGAEPAARPAFDHSRRLPGPNRHFAQPAVVLTPLGSLAASATALHAWAARVRAVCAALGWAEPDPQAHRHPVGTTLAFRADAEVLLTATEINEWAWERVAAAADDFDWEQPLEDDATRVAAHFAARAADERSRPLQRLRVAAAEHGLPLFEDDDAVSIGAGRSSVTHPRAALPLPMDLPWATLHDVPTLLVTGSNGKTTTARLLAAFVRAAGRTPGLCSTEGIVVGDTLVERGDYAGPAGARAVLRHRGVDVAVLETARGGILRRGLALTRADAAIVTNVSADHLGEYGIATVEDIAEVKLVVARAVQRGGVLVLNAADEVLMATAARLPHSTRARQALFAPEHRHPRLVAHRAAGGSTCGVEGGQLICHHEGTAHELGAITAMPLTLGGAAGYNTLNIAAAVLATAAIGVPREVLRATLAAFGSTRSDNPGRLERFVHRGATVLIDYAHNPDGLSQLLAVARALQPAPRRLALLLGQAGNRDDAAIAELARAAAAARPDRIVIKELPAMLRGRLPGEVPALLRAALVAAGIDPARIADHADELSAARCLLAWASPGDVVVLPIHTVAVREALASDGAACAGAPA